MGATVKFGVPYQITVRAADLGSSKAISNSFFYRALASTGPMPAYGAIVAGGGDLNTVLGDFITAWDGIRALLNHNYQTVDYSARSIVGKKFGSPSLPIAGLASSLNTVVTTGVPHGLVTGDTVNIYGVTTPAAANGVWVITVIGPTSFFLNGSGTFASWSGDGAWQRATGKQELSYGDTALIASVGVGGIAGDALPLFTAASVRRLNIGVGRNFRSRVSLGPMSESDSLDGGWVTGTRTAWGTALAAFYSASISNGSTDALQNVMVGVAMSTQLALALPSPFTQADSWTKTVTGYSLQRNAGSMTRRKPRLTIPIT